VAAPSRAAVATIGAPRLAIDRLVVDGDTPGRPAIEALSLSVRPGEIVGIAGVSGNGQRELMAALTGVLPLRGGALRVDGAPYAPTRRQMRERGVSSLPEEPLHNACVGKLSVEENLALRNYDQPPLARLGAWLSRRAMRTQAQARIADYKVKTTGPRAPIASLSGGNVQRAVLARELSQAPRLLLVANPCFGLDFQATAEIHARLRAARDGGTGVLLISEDLDELLALSDRLLVLSHGHVAYECTLGGGSVDMAAIGRAMAGEPAGDTTEPLPH
jgi:simple sugar transport system ATP-binding protein